MLVVEDNHLFPIARGSRLTMAKALTGHLGAPSTTQLVAEAARLRRRVADLQLQVAALAEENERLTALHTADLDTVLAGELSNA